MGYDPIEVEQAAIQAARAVRKNGGAGYSEHLTASFVIPAPEDVTTDVTLMATGFKWFSSATPTKEEFLSGKLTATKDGYSDSMAISKLEHSVVAEATGAYCVRVEHLNYIVSTVTENELGTLPKPGIYYSSTPLIDKPEEHLIGVKYTFDFGERIHPIDPKYLLVVVNFDELGLTNAILSLLNNGGGDLFLPSVDGGAAVSEAMCKAIPLDRSYIAKLTVPGMGVMNVTPIYTLKDDYGFKVAHFDSYTESNGALTKFYVRLYRNTNSANYDAGMIRVGFY